MSRFWRLKTARFEAPGDHVLVISPDSAPNELNIMVESGTVEIEGDNDAPTNVFGTIPESAVIVGAGQAYSLTEEQYKLVTITIKAGAIVQLTANL
jgi:hypothetical protein